MEKVLVSYVAASTVTAEPNQALSKPPPVLDFPVSLTPLNRSSLDQQAISFHQQNRLPNTDHSLPLCQP